MIYVEQVRRISHGLGHIVVSINLGRWYRVQKLIVRWVDVSSMSSQYPLKPHHITPLIHCQHILTLFFFTNQTINQSRPFTTEYQVLFPGGSASMGFRHYPSWPFLLGHLQTGQDVLNTASILDIAHIAF